MKKFKYYILCFSRSGHATEFEQIEYEPKANKKFYQSISISIVNYFKSHQNYESIARLLLYNLNSAGGKATYYQATSSSLDLFVNEKLGLL